MNRQELEEKAIYIAEHDMEIIIFNTVDEVRSMTESAPTEALEAIVNDYEAEYGKLVKYRVEFFHIGSGKRETAEEWLVEEDRYPDLTAVDYMECEGFEFDQSDLEGGIIVTLFIEGKPVSSVLWHKWHKTDEAELIEELMDYIDEIKAFHGWK